MNINITKDLQELVVWTSGSSEGENCDVERMYTWCSNSALIPEIDVKTSDSWLDVSAGTKRCLAMAANISAAALTHADCAEKRPFLCQVQPCQLGWYISVLLAYSKTHIGILEYTANMLLNCPAFRSIMRV